MLICLQLKIQHNSNKLAKLWNKLCESPCVRRRDWFPTTARHKCPFCRHASLAARHRCINAQLLARCENHSSFFPSHLRRWSLLQSDGLTNVNADHLHIPSYLRRFWTQTMKQTKLVENLCQFAGLLLLGRWPLTSPAASCYEALQQRYVCNCSKFCTFVSASLWQKFPPF